MASTGGCCFHPEDEEDLGLHLTLTEAEENEMAALAADDETAE